MLIGRFHTYPLERPDGEVGIFEFNLEIPTEILNLHRARKEYIIHEIADTLMKLCYVHQLPREAWFFDPTDRIQQLTLLPARIPFG